MSNKTGVMIGIVVLLLAALTLSIMTIKKQKSDFKDQQQLYNAVTDTLQTWKDKDSLNNAKIQIMETDKAKDFLKLENLTGLNLELQNLVKKQGKKIKDLNAALILESETSYTDTMRLYYPIGGDTIVFSKSILLDTVDNEWINAMYGFNKGKSHFELFVRNKYEVTFGVEGKSWFKRGTPYANVKNLNPYTSTKDMRVYQVSAPKQDRWGISLQSGYGLLYDVQRSQFGHGAFIGLGINYNIISW